MNTKVKGIDEALKNLKKISERAKEIEGENKIKFTELFPDSFMRRYTDFKSIEGFVEHCEKSLNVDFSSIDTNEENFNKLVKEGTSFENWDEMIDKATTEWVGKKLSI